MIYRNLILQGIQIKEMELYIHTQQILIKEILETIMKIESALF